MRPLTCQYAKHTLQAMALLWTPLSLFRIYREALRQQGFKAHLVMRPDFYVNATCSHPDPFNCGLFFVFELSFTTLVHLHLVCVLWIPMSIKGACNFRSIVLFFRTFSLHGVNFRLFIHQSYYLLFLGSTALLAHGFLLPTYLTYPLAPESPERHFILYYTILPFFLLFSFLPFGPLYSWYLSFLCFFSLPLFQRPTYLLPSSYS